MAGPVECVARRRVQSRLTGMVLKLQEELSNELDLQIKGAEKLLVSWTNLGNLFYFSYPNQPKTCMKDPTQKK
ncbi:unnamed protein product [Brassica oleracea]